MARGWESKSVESQIEEAEERKRLLRGKEYTAEQKRLLRELRVLQLSRTRVLQQISEATHDRYREMLRCALADVDRKISEMEGRLSVRPEP